jgi:hypothetical protein
MEIELNREGKSKGGKVLEIKQPERLSWLIGRRVVDLESAFVARGIESLSTACKQK